MKYFLLLITGLVFLSGCTSRRPSADQPDMIPIPVQAEMKKGNFTINGRTEILVNSSDEKVKMVADGLKEKLSVLTGNTISSGQAGTKQPRNSIFLKLDESLSDSLGKCRSIPQFSFAYVGSQNSRCGLFLFRT